MPDAPGRAHSTSPHQGYLLFTDGAVESGVASIGGVLCSHEGYPIAHFGRQVPQVVTQAWLQTDSEHPVFQAELLAALAALHLWPQTLHRSLCTLFIDNEGVKNCIIKGSAYPASNALLMANFLQQESVLELGLWVERVPNASNPADAPAGASSLTFSGLLGVTRSLTTCFCNCPS